MTKYYEKRVTEFEIDSDLKVKNLINEIETGVSIDFTNFNKYFESKRGTKRRSDLDCELSNIIYEAISKSKLDQKFIYDLRFWQWVCLNPLKEYCIWRWDISLELPEIHKPERFLGAGGVTGFSKNSASRLYIPASILINEIEIKDLEDGNNLFESFWSNQQKELSICQSVLSMNKNVFIAAVRAADGLDTEEIKSLMVELNFLSSSSFLDIMSHEEIYHLTKD
tara:strand:- start:637 stop:1308 length:672 start_codon:yes stop_codon:yes gene_type:complete